MTAIQYELTQPTSSSIVGDGVVVSSFLLKENGLEPIGDPTEEDWVACGIYIRQAKEAVHFWLGDWLNFAQTKWGEKYKTAVEKSGFKYQTLANDKFVASRIEFSRRRENLSFDHHATVSDLAPDQQEELLSYAEKTDMSTKDFRKFVDDQTMRTKPQPEKEKSDYTPTDASHDAERILSHADTLIIWLGDLDITLLREDEKKRLKKKMNELQRKIDILFTFN